MIDLVFFTVESIYFIPVDLKVELTLGFSSMSFSSEISIDIFFFTILLPLPIVDVRFTPRAEFFPREGAGGDASSILAAGEGAPESLKADTVVFVGDILSSSS